ncbi:hypothetical protein B0H21DRAFT_731001 [Amylocystis lapponica]|nr:hypothetical protein B0H21DRAFT_731001 [Amylocystis lapponica]
MHRALDNFDIVSEVFEHVPSDPSQHLDLSDRYTLAQAARVCRVFSDPALNVLWRHLFNPLPLFRLFTPLQQTQRRHDREYWTDGDISEYNLAQFQPIRPANTLN